MTTWFESSAQANFERFLPDRSWGPEGRVLVQVGVWAGDATAWLLDHALVLGDTLYDVDTFAGTPGEHDEAAASEAYGRYHEMKREKDPFLCVRTSRCTSDVFFEHFPDEAWADFVYVDGDHSFAQVARDVENAWRSVKPGGILACDDYQWYTPDRRYDRPYPALVNFRELHLGEYEVLEDGYQLWLRKG